MAHEIPLAGHLGESKTKQRIKYSFFWPKLKQDGKSHFVAARPVSLGRGLTYRDRIPITPIVRPENPFEDALGIAPRFATPGHPESMGAVERWNRTLKEMLNKNIQENGNNWDSHLPYLMFAYREVPHSTTGV
ncbi:retrovirus-related Pol polyprotein from transposon opus [Trichonephila clavipes]|nr:retrovirus-related Pol polyprotein from transposon opus [Trichonephila clavipes]